MGTSDWCAASHGALRPAFFVTNTGRTRRRKRDTAAMRPLGRAPLRHALLHCKHVGHPSGHPRRGDRWSTPQGGGGGAGQARRGRAGGGAAAAHEPPPQLARPASTAATQRQFGRGHWAVAALQLHAGATESSAGRSRARLLAHARRAALRAQLQAGGPLRTGARLGVAPLRRPRRCQIRCACTV